MKLRNVESISTFALAMLLVSAPSFAQQTVQIAAAANLTKVFQDDIIPAFTKKTGITISPTFGATGLLSKQLENGAPYEVFVSADVVTANKLADEGFLDSKSVKTYVVGQLALWSKSLPVATQGLAILTTSAVTNIAVANPKTAPYGEATIETLNSMKLFDKVQSKIVYAENINQALQYGQSGNADVSFTALSLVKPLTTGSYMIVPADAHAPIAQALGVTPKASVAAHRFADFLMSGEGQELFKAEGYLPPSAAKK